MTSKNTEASTPTPSADRLLATLSPIHQPIINWNDWKGGKDGRGGETERRRPVSDPCFPGKG